MTGYIYNAFGQYEKRGKELGMTLKYAGVEFWLPYKKVTPIPDFHFRELDHAGTAEAWENGNEDAVIYAVHRIPGVRVVEELTEARGAGGDEQIKNSSRGIIALAPTKERLTEKYVKAWAGADEDGRVQTEEVREVKPTAADIEAAETLALEFKKLEIERYFLSKRDRMAGQQGYRTPTGLIREYMKELNVKDIDQVTVQNTPAAAPGLSPEVAQEYLALLAQALIKGITGDQAVKLAQNAAAKLAE